AEVRDDVRLVLEPHAPLLQRCMRVADVVHAVVEDGCGVVERRLFRTCEHQTDAGAVEERHVRHLEQEAEAEHIAVEGDGAVEVAGRDRDLADRREAERRGACGHGGIASGLGRGRGWRGSRPRPGWRRTRGANIFSPANQYEEVCRAWQGVRARRASRRSRCGCTPRRSGCCGGCGVKTMRWGWGGGGGVGAGRAGGWCGSARRRRAYGCWRRGGGGGSRR